jgi:plastocyanin
VARGIGRGYGDIRGSGCPVVRRRGQTGYRFRGMGKRRRSGWARLSLLTLAALAAVLAATALGSSSKAVHSVTAGDNFFEPTKVTIGAGEKVKWTNNGSSDHTVKFKGEKNEVIGPGETTSKRFKQTGRFPYKCTLHAGMDGKVVVKDQ